MESQHRVVPSHLLRTQITHVITTPCRTKKPTSDTNYTCNHNTVPYQATYFGHKLHMESQHRAVPSHLLRTQTTQGITTPCRTKPPTSDTNYTWNHNTMPCQAAYFGHKLHMEHNTVPYQAAYFGHKLHMESQHRAVPSRLLRTQTTHGTQHRAVPSRLLRTQTTHVITTPYQASYFGHKLHM